MRERSVPLSMPLARPLSRKPLDLSDRVAVPPLTDLVAETRRLSRLLRTGFEELAAEELARLLSQVAAALADLARRRGDAQHMNQVAPALQEVTLATARRDPIALADALEYGLAQQLALCAEPGTAA